MNQIIFMIAKYVVLGLAVIAIYIAHAKFNFNDNNIVEDVIEKEVQSQTGINLNLETPSSSSSDENNSAPKQ